MIGNDQPIYAMRCGQLRILDAEDAFEQDRTAPRRLEPFDIAPVHRQVVLASDELGDGHRIRGSGLGALEIPEGDARTQSYIEEPGEMAGEVEDRRERETRRHGEAVAHVALARPLYLGVHSEHQRGAARRPRALDELLCESPVAQHVELEPLRLGGLGGDLLDAASGHGGQAVGHVVFLRGAGGGQLAAARQQSGESGRREDQRRGAMLAEQGDRLVARGYVGQHPGTEAPLLEVFAVGAQRGLILGSAVDELEYHSRQTPARPAAQIFDVDCLHGLVLLKVIKRLCSYRILVPT